MRRLATHPPATASTTCIDAPIPIRSSFIRPVKRSASTAPDGTPEKKLLSNNFVVRRHVPPWGLNVPAHTILCLPVDKTLSPRNTHNIAKELTTLSRKYDTGVSTRWSRASILFSGHDEDPVFTAVSTTRSRMRKFCASLAHHEFTSALLAQRRCSNASNELELHCLCAPILSRVARTASSSETPTAKKIFPARQLALTKT